MTDTLLTLPDTKAILSNLSELDWDFSKEKTGYLTHDLHPYAAKFIPQIPATLIKQLSFPNELIWDPFGGSGTTALEAVLAGRRAISTDINPLASILGKAKVTVLTEEQYLALCKIAHDLELICISNEQTERFLADNKAEYLAYIPDIPNIAKWFHPTAINELAYIRWFLSTRLTTDKQKFVAQVAFSRTVLKVSYQDGETRYTSKPKPINLGTTLQTFSRELRFCIDRVRSLRDYGPLKEAEFFTWDLRQPLDNHSCIQRESVSLIVTSPPYPNAYDYYLYHRFRIFWLGFDPRDLGKAEIGSHLRHQKESTGFDDYVLEMSKCLTNFWWALQPGRFAVLVVGDGIFKGVTYPTAKELAKVASEIGFDVVGILNRTIHQTKRTFTSAARRAKQEQILIVRKR